MKVSELEGALLDYWAGKAERIISASLRIVSPQNACEWRDRSGLWRRWSPSTKWGQGGPIIDRERIGLMPAVEGGVAFWIAAHQDYSDPVRGSTPTIAAMRAYVACKFGNEVPEVSQ